MSWFYKTKAKIVEAGFIDDDHGVIVLIDKSQMTLKGLTELEVRECAKRLYQTVEVVLSEGKSDA